MSLEVLRELRLILRVMRFKRMTAEFHEIIGTLCDQSRAIAAE